MPNPWKTPPQSDSGGGGVSRLLSCLRAERGGSLVVQTGFPTSLADLFVKNRGRLKKPARKKKRQPLPKPAAPAPPSSCGLPPGVSSATRSLPTAEHVSLPTLGTAEAQRRGAGVVFAFLSVMTLVMVALAIERKKLVAGIMMSSFALWLLDSIGVQVGIGHPCSDAEKRLNPVVGGSDLDGRGVVSPIREIGIGSCSDSVRSEGSLLESFDSDQASEDLSERKDFVAVGKDFLEHDIGSKGISKARKLFRKLVPKKFRVPKDTRDGEGLSERGIITGITEIEEEEEATNADDDAVLSSRDALLINASHKFTVHDKEDIEIIQVNGSGISSRSSYQLVFCTIVLLGLLGGKSVALVLSLSWFLFHKSIKSLWKKGRGFAT